VDESTPKGQRCFQENRERRGGCRAKKKKVVPSLSHEGKKKRSSHLSLVLELGEVSSRRKGEEKKGVGKQEL